MCARAWPRCRSFPAAAAMPGKRKLRLAVTPTFARSILIPRLRQFTEAYPEIDVTLQVSIPLLDVVAEDADLMVRFGTGPLCRRGARVPAQGRGHAPGLARLRARARAVRAPQDLEGVPLLRSPLEPWRTWFAATSSTGPSPARARSSTTSA
jgi:LysR family glycine cleavage system transcriptional activator